MDRARMPTRLGRLGDDDDESFVESLTPAQRMELVWPLTRQVWAFVDGTEDEPRLRRHVGRVVRGGR